MIESKSPGLDARERSTNRAAASSLLSRSFLSRAIIVYDESARSSVGRSWSLFAEGNVPTTRAIPRSRNREPVGILSRPERVTGTDRWSRPASVSMRRKRGSNSPTLLCGPRPVIGYLPAFQPPPIPKRNRPPQIWSIEAASFCRLNRIALLDKANANIQLDLSSQGITSISVGA